MCHHPSTSFPHVIEHRPEATASSAPSQYPFKESMLLQLDHPQMSSTPARPSSPNIEISFASSASKTLYHYAYNNSKPQPRRGNYSGSTQGRPVPSIESLSAAITSFQAKTKNLVPLIQTKSSSLFITYARPSKSHYSHDRIHHR